MRFASIFILSIATFLGFQGVANAGVNTQTATMKVYKVNLYPNADCTGTAQTVFDNSAGESIDMAASPTIASGATVTDGTYNCFAMKMSDNVTFTPAANDGTSCVAGTSYTLDVCQPRVDGSTTTTPYYYNPEGSAAPSDAAGYTACTTGNDTVWVFVSTASTATDGSSGHNAFSPPNSSGACQYSADPSPGCGFKLSNAITISGTTTGTFIFDTDGKVVDQYGSCDMEAPNFGYE